MISAKTPAKGPIPTATVKSIAQNKSGIVLTKFKKDLYKKYEYLFKFVALDA